MTIKKVNAPDTVWYNNPASGYYAANFVMGKFNRKGELTLTRIPRTGNCRDSILKQIHEYFCATQNADDTLNLFLVANRPFKINKGNILPKWKIMNQLKGLLTAEFLDWTYKQGETTGGSAYCTQKSCNSESTHQKETMRIIHFSITRSAYISPLFSWMWTQFVRTKFTGIVSSHITNSNGEYGKLLKLLCKGIRSGEIFERVPENRKPQNQSTVPYTGASGPMGYMRTYAPSGVLSYINYDNLTQNKNIVVQNGKFYGGVDNYFRDFDIKELKRKQPYDRVFFNVNRYFIDNSINKLNVFYKEFMKILNPYKTKKVKKNKRTYRDMWDGTVRTSYVYSFTKREKEKIHALIKQFNRN